VTSSVQLLGDNKNIEQATGCQHLHTIVDEIEPCIEQDEFRRFKEMNQGERETFVDEIARRNVLRTVQEIRTRSGIIARAVAEGNALVAGALYDVKSGEIEFLVPAAHSKTVAAPS
jgi:carbonic anhydrase/SulP family sulfate permease